MANPIRTKLNSHAQVNREIEASVKRMADLYRKCRLEINDMLRKKVMSSRDPFAGQNLIRLIESLSEAYGELEEAFREEFEYAIPYVAQNNAFFAQLDMGDRPVGKIDQGRINLMLEDSFAHVAGATGNMRKADVAFLRETSATVFREASVTGKTREEVSNELLGKILSRPEKFKFTDAGGRVWDNRTYVEMLGRTVLHNAGREAYFDTCAEKGKDVVRVTVSGDSCPACAEWENRLLSISGNTPGLPTVADAQAAGLLHPNCTHSFVAVGDSVRQRKYDENGRPKSGVNSAPKFKGDRNQNTQTADQDNAKQTANEEKNLSELGISRIVGEHTREQDRLAVNPYYHESDRYRNNCPKAAIAYEMRRRGYAVQAAPASPKDNKGRETDIFLDDRSMRIAFKNANYIDCSGKNVKANICSEMEKMPDGARCAVQVLWNKKDGHYFIGERINGKTVFSDPQKPFEMKKDEAAGYLDKIIGEEAAICRLDNLEIGDMLYLAITPE